MTRKESYLQYLQSPQWWTIRDRRLAVAGHRCEFRPEKGWYNNGPLYGDRCTEKRNLDVHHLSYERLGAERDSDLEVLCRQHHLVRHIMSFECEVCGAQIHDEDGALTLIKEHRRCSDLPTLEDMGLAGRGYDHPLLCWDCSNSLSGD